MLPSRLLRLLFYWLNFSLVQIFEKRSRWDQFAHTQSTLTLGFSPNMSPKSDSKGKTFAFLPLYMIQLFISEGCTTDIMLFLPFDFDFTYMGQ